MENTTSTPDEHYYGDLAREYATLQDRVAPDLARIDEIKKLMRGLDYGTHDVAGLKVSVARNSRLDAAAFAAKYPVLQHPGLYKSAPDSAAIKKNLAPAEIETLSVAGEPRVTIK